MSRYASSSSSSSSSNPTRTNHSLFVDVDELPSPTPSSPVHLAAQQPRRPVINLEELPSPTPSPVRLAAHRPRPFIDLGELPSPTSPPPNPTSTQHMETSQLAASSSKPKITRPLTMDAMIQDISSRRDALVRALTTDQEDFFRLCDPTAGRKPLLLYGHADGSWEVTWPEEDAPPDMPEPAAGLNLVRDDMTRFDWLSRVAVRADAWLAGLTHCFGATLNANQKMHLFDMLIDLPTVYETFEKSYKHDSVLLPTNMPPSSDLGQNVSNPNKDSTIPAEENLPLGPGLMQNVSNPKSGSWTHDEDSDEELEVSDQTFCGACGAPYHANGFWIGCDFCDRWFHGKCVKIKASEAQHICQYKCPDCMQNEIGE